MSKATFEETQGSQNYRTCKMVASYHTSCIDNWLFLISNPISTCVLIFLSQERGDALLGRRTIQLATLSFLFVGFIFTTSSALAYWNEVTVTRDVEIVTVGEPIELIVDNINDIGDVRLVPAGYVISVGDVDKVEFQYEVSVSRELLATVNLHANVSQVLINEDDTYSHLIDIDIMGFGNEAVMDLYNDTITLLVTIRIIEPIDAEEALELGLDASLVNVEDSVLAYESIKGQQISFTLELFLEQKPETQTETEPVNNN